MIQQSGFTYVTQVPNQVGLHIFDSASQPIGFINLSKSLHDWILQIYITGLNMNFSTNYKYDFYDQYQKYLKREIIL